MRGYSITYAGIFDINQTIFLAGLPDNLADGRIVNVRYFREKMMFDLEIQPAYQPGNNRILRGEIGGGLDLMDSPLVFQFIGFNISHRKGRMFHRMRQLKYKAQHKTCHTGENNEPDYPIRKTQ